MIKGFSDISWSHFFIRADNGITRGHNWKLKKKSIDLIYASTSSSVKDLSVVRWNSLIPDKVDAPAEDELIQEPPGRTSTKEDGLLWTIWSSSNGCTKQKLYTRYKHAVEK